METLISSSRIEHAVALQGTIDSFALSDVLRLLAHSNKTGRLVVNGERGSASVWLVGGDFVGGQTSSDPTAVDLVDVCFDILRYEAGSFIFESDAHCPAPQPSTPVGAVLEQAEAFLLEWRDIISIVPSMDAWVVLAPELPHPEVVVDQACWTSIVAVGGGVRVSELSHRLGLGELPSCRLVRALVHAGFVRVEVDVLPTDDDIIYETDAPELVIAAEPTADSEPMGLPALPSRPVAASLDDQAPAVEDPFGEFDPFGAEPSEDLEGVALPSLTIGGLTDDPFAPESFPARGLDDADDDVDDGDEDVARGLSMLSPQAAQAVAAAEQTTGDDDGRDSVIRFLGSV